MRGGIYYHDGIVTATYENGYLDAKVAVVAHHNGFFEMHVCDVEKCGGEISTSCFRNKHCYQLLRDKNTSCESRNNQRCAPVDPKYPGRWYLPCKKNPDYDVFGGGDTMRFLFPKGLRCKHCVLSWFWTSANTCNPPGVIEFFEGPRGPNWNKCWGEAGAQGGYTKVQQPCAGSRFPEEYYQCADIAVLPNGANNMPTTRPPTKATTRKPSITRATTRRTTRGTTRRTTKRTMQSGNNPGSGNNGPIQSILYYADGMQRRVLRAGETSYIDPWKFNQFTFEAKLSRRAGPVSFLVNGRKIWTDYLEKYFMMGNVGSKPNYWKNPIYNKKFRLEVRAESFSYVVYIVLRRNLN